MNDTNTTNFNAFVRADWATGTFNSDEDADLDLIEVDIRTLTAEQRYELRGDAASNGDADLVATIDSL